MTMFRTLLLSLTMVTLTLVGCSAGSKGAKVSGTLMNNGKAYLPPDKGSANIQFVPAEAGSKLPTCSGSADPTTGMFEIAGPEAKQRVLPGKYKVAVTATVPGTYKDLFEQAFAGNNTPLTYEVTADPEQKIVIDLAKKTITKQ